MFLTLMQTGMPREQIDGKRTPDLWSLCKKVSTEEKGQSPRSYLCHPLPAVRMHPVQLLLHTLAFLPGNNRGCLVSLHQDR